MKEMELTCLPVHLQRPLVLRVGHVIVVDNNIYKLLLLDGLVAGTP